MTRISLPNRERAHKAGLVALWSSEASSTDSFYTRCRSILSILAIRLRAAPLATVGAIVSLTAVISLAFLMMSVAANTRRILTRGTQQISVRIVPLQSDMASEIAERLQRYHEAKEVRIISKSEALEEFSTALGNAQGLLDGLENDNPLPVTIDMSLTNLGGDPEASVAALVDRLHREEGVAEVVYNASLVASLGELLRGVRIFGGVAVVGVLLLGAVVVGMNIRLGIYAHRQEIEIMQLVGAERAQIQLPFLVEAISAGLISSLLSIIIISISMSWLGSVLNTSSLAWMFAGEPLAVPWGVMLGVVLAGPLLAYVGARVALRMQGRR